MPQLGALYLQGVFRTLRKEVAGCVVMHSERAMAIV